eukprot:10549391-Alexandrium_andersonii.AAC.1
MRWWLLGLFCVSACACACPCAWSVPDRAATVLDCNNATLGACRCLRGGCLDLGGRGGNRQPLAGPAT